MAHEALKMLKKEKKTTKNKKERLESQIAESLFASFAF
jgi:hypothetical protein